MITQLSVEAFLEQLASSSPTPGGGSAAAVVGAMGAALISMVCNVTLAKKGQEAARPEMQAVLADCEALRRRLTAMVADDVAAFDALMSAYRLPKSSDAQRAARSGAIQAALRAATQTPLDCAAAAAQVIPLAQRAAAAGYAGVVSDAGVGVLAAHTAVRSAALNVFVNIPPLEDRGFAEQAKQAIEALLERCARDAEAVFATVRARL